ncbi:MAG: hypothetical protein IEMM0006_1001 [bacterium]|nr:MAG: hypothetical protein IEMM0006_1001 [bacterium]
MQYLPISLKIKGKKVLIIGGGHVALHKMKLLRRFTKEIMVIGKQVNQQIKDSGSRYREQEYSPSVLDGYDLIYVCTDNRALNHRIKQDANKKGLLVNVADDPGLSDFVSPAIYKNKNMTVAVGSDAKDVKQAISLRNRIKEILENDQKSQNIQQKT